MLIARLIDLIRNDLICVPVRLCACAPVRLIITTSRETIESASVSGVVSARSAFSGMVAVRGSCRHV